LRPLTVGLLTRLPWRLKRPAALLNAFVRYPAWSPLGNQIVYEYNETSGNIWLMELK